MTIDRDDLAKRVLKTTQTLAQGYRDAINQWSTQEKRATAKASANAAHNAGVFILMDLGFSMGEIKNMLEAYHQKTKVSNDH